MTERERWADEGFAAGALYDAARPSYPAAAVARVVSDLELDRSSRIVDLGAGTGIFTRLIADHVGEVVAVEPSASMRASLAEASPGVTVLEGRDDAIPLEDGWADAVVVAQAFHWFDAPRALAEIARVLRPGGGLGLVWNERDESWVWVRRLTRAMRWDENRPFDGRADWAGIVSRGPFRRVTRHDLPWLESVSPADLQRRVATTSYVTLLGEAERVALLADVAEVLADQPDPLALPYRSIVVTARRA